MHIKHSQNLLAKQIGQLSQSLSVNKFAPITADTANNCQSSQSLSVNKFETILPITANAADNNNTANTADD
jgi:hypothetical protein